MAVCRRYYTISNRCPQRTTPVSQPQSPCNQIERPVVHQGTDNLCHLMSRVRGKALNWATGQATLCPSLCLATSAAASRDFAFPVGRTPPSRTFFSPVGPQHPRLIHWLSHLHERSRISRISGGYGQGAGLLTAFTPCRFVRQRTR